MPSKRLTAEEIAEMATCAVEPPPKTYEQYIDDALKALGHDDNTPLGMDNFMVSHMLLNEMKAYGCAPEGEGLTGDDLFKAYTKYVCRRASSAAESVEIDMAPPGIADESVLNMMDMSTADATLRSVEGYFPEFKPEIHITGHGPHPLLLQIDSADPFYHAMIGLHQERHQAYADRQVYEYRVDAVPSDLSQWWRVQAIYDALNEGYPFVVFLDADAWIADISVDLRDALPEPLSLGMCIHPLGFGNNAQWHYNTGVVYIRNTPEAKIYLKDVLSHHGKAAYDQVPMNDLLLNDPLYAGICQPIAQKWNQNIDHPATGLPIVAAAHGCGTPLERLNRMEKWVKANA